MTANLAVSYFFTAETSGQDLQKLVPGLIEKPEYYPKKTRSVGEFLCCAPDLNPAFIPAPGQDAELTHSHSADSRRQIVEIRVYAQEIVLCPLV
jgi:hypothetical protein